MGFFNDRVVQAVSSLVGVVNPFPKWQILDFSEMKAFADDISNLTKMAKSSPNVLKTLWEKEKLLITSNFSFSHSVFKWLVLQTRKNRGLFGKGLKPGPMLYKAWVHTQVSLCSNLNPLAHNDDFWRTGEKSLLKTLWEMKKILVTSIFFFSHNVFYPMKDNLNVWGNI